MKANFAAGADVIFSPADCNVLREEEHPSG